MLHLYTSGPIIPLSPDTKRPHIHRCCPVDQHGVCQLMSFGYSSFRRCTKLVIIIINYHHRRSGPRTEQLLLLATTCNFKFTFFFPFNYHFGTPITYLKYNRPPRILHSLLILLSSFCKLLSPYLSQLKM